MKSKLFPASVIVVIAAIVTAGIIFAIQRTGAGIQTRSGADPVTASSVAELTRASDLVVIGTLRGEAGTRKIPQGDSSRPVANPKRFSILRDFEISVDRYLKGSGAETITVSVLIGVEEEIRATTLFEDQGTPLDQGVRYVLFLRKAQTPTSVEFVSAAEPWRFRLQNGRAEIQSPIQFPRFPQDQFPETEAELLSQVAAAR